MKCTTCKKELAGSSKAKKVYCLFCAKKQKELVEVLPSKEFAEKSQKAMDMLNGFFFGK